MWVCIVLNVIIIICLFWENKSLKTIIRDWQKGLQENLEENKHRQKEFKESFECFTKAIQGELTGIKEKEESSFEVLFTQIEGLEKCFEQFNLIKDALDNISELSTKIREDDRKHYSETKKIMRELNEKCSLLQKDFDIIEELFRLQLVNSLIDDADSAMKLYEEMQKNNKKK